MGNKEVSLEELMQKTTDGLVSIITPLYNGEKYIEQAIESVQAQTYPMWEMLIIDDASTDDSITIVKQIQAKDSRIKLLHNKTNCGAAYSRNLGLQEAKGRYVAFLDSDDVWLSHKLQMQLDKMQEEEVGFCYGNCHVIDENGMICGKTRVAPACINYKKLLYGNPIPCVTVLLDRWMVGQVQMPMIGHEDYATWLNILKERIPYAVGVEEVVAEYRENRSSLSGNKKKAIKWQWHIYRRYLKFNVIKSVYYFIAYAYQAVKKR